MLGFLIYILLGIGFGMDAYWNTGDDLKEEEPELYPWACAVYGLFWAPFMLLTLIIKIKCWFGDHSE